MPLPNDRADAPRTGDAGQFLEGRFAQGSLSRKYRLFVPENLSASPGLVMMLHGCKQDPDDFARGTRMNEFASAADCLVVYPAQSSRANVNACWNWFEKDHQRRDRGEAGLLGHLVRDLVARHAVQRSRVFVAGLSAGGAMAAVLADEYPDLFAAACVHSGLPAGAASNLSEALRAMRSGPAAGGQSATTSEPDALVPTIIFHGAQDRTVDAINADAIVASLIARKGRESLSVPQQVGLKDAKQRRVTRTIYRDVDGRTLVEDWRAHGASHAWFGGAADGSFTDPNGIDATREMMRFFAEHARVPAEA